MVAVREGERIHATTVTSFASISVDPPLVLVSLGPSAQVLPFLDAGTRFVVNVLSREQRRLASVFADSYPVGASPFPTEGPPVLEGAQASLICAVDRWIPLENGVRLVLARVEDAVLGDPAGGPLLHYLREYRGLD